MNHPIQPPESPTTESHRTAVLRRYYPLVRAVLNRMRRRLPEVADVEELHSVGVAGLVAAVDHYDAEQAATFPAYASLRIRGAILDALRRLDTLSRARRKRFREIQATVAVLEQRHGRTPTDAELAQALGLSVGELRYQQARCQPVQTVSMDAEATNDDSGDQSLHERIADSAHTPAVVEMERREELAQMAAAIKALPERQQRILAMYYFEGLRFSEIAAAYGVTEARICQIHAQSLKRLRQHMEAAIPA